MKIAITIPFYNENQNLHYLINEWSDLFDKEKFLDEKYEFKFFFFNDGSTDDSEFIIKNTKKNFRYEIINKKNSGHGDTCIYAYRHIIKLNKFEYIVQIDSDNQCNPKYLINFLDHINSYDFIFGNRKKREDGKIRLLATKILSFSVLILTSIKIKDLNVPYRIMKCDKLKTLLPLLSTSTELKNALLTFIIMKSYKIKWINITFRKRQYGYTHFKMSSMFKYFINLIISILKF